MADYRYTNIFKPYNDPTRQAAAQEAIGFYVPVSAQTAVSNSTGARIPLPSILGPTPARRLELQRRAESKSDVLVRVGRVDSNGNIIYDTEPNAGVSNVPRVPTQYGKNAERPSAARPNPLDNYVNVIYGLSLHAIRPNGYNEIVEGKSYTTGEGGAGTVLIASGGRRDNNLFRNQYFNQDLFFESLKLNTVIGHNDRSRGSNVIDLNFTILEPLSVSFVERLLKVAKELGIPSWDQMFFMIQIDFFANTDDGNMVNLLPGQTKYLPIKILDMQIKVNTQGSTYSCTAIPASHMAMMESSASTPVIFEVLSGTLGEFFSASDSAVESNRPSGSNTSQRQSTAQPAAGSSAKVEQIYSFVDAMNKHQENLVEQKVQDQADVYRFVLSESIKNATILHKRAINSSANVPVTVNNNKAKTKSTIDTQKELTRINAGTSVLDAANQMIRNSSFFVDLIEKDSTGTTNKDKPIKTFKFTSSIKLGKWDTKRKKYQKTITYYIKEYDYFNTKFPKTKKSVPSSWVKEYYYMYTGKNQQIIDFTIDFNTMFIVNITAFSEQKDEGLVNQNPQQPLSTAISTPEENKSQTARINPVVGQTQVHATGSSTQSAELVAAGDLYKSMMSGSRGDMINVKLKISGDPEFIKQDDLFVTTDRSGTEPLVNNSVNMDVGEVHVYLTFNTPEDINDETGLYKGLSENRNIFSGIYKVITIENEFSRGQFVQTLDLIRLFEQDEDISGGVTNNRAAIDPKNIPESQGSLLERQQFAMANESPMNESMTQTTRQTTEPITQVARPNSTLPGSIVPNIRQQVRQRIQEGLRNVPVTNVPLEGPVPFAE